MERFLKERRDMDNFGHIIDATLFRNEERRVLSAALGPICESAIAFVAAYETHTAKIKDTATKVCVKLGADQ
jgi:hypothetical protein